MTNVSILQNNNNNNNLFIDLSSRFYINIPLSEQQGVRLMYHIEQMYFFIYDQLSILILKYNLEEIKWKENFNLQFFIDEFKKWFCQMNNPTFSLEKFSNLWEEYIEIYKKKIPISAILLYKKNQKEKDNLLILMIEGKESRKWGLPKGKRNENETWYECACREMIEETGYNGLTILNKKLKIELKEKPIPLNELNFNFNRSISRDYHSYPRRPKTLVNCGKKENKNEIFYMDLHELKNSHLKNLVLESNGNKLENPTRVYFLSYDWIMEKIKKEAPSLLHLLQEDFVGDEKEVSQIEWKNWKSLYKNHKLALTWQIKKHYLILNKALQFLT